MKKILALLLVLVMVFSLVACASKTETPATETTTEETATETTTEEKTEEPAAEEEKTEEPAAEEGKAKGVKGLPIKLGMEMAAEMIAKIKDEHLCDGVHIMAIGAEKNVPAILDLAGITI